MLTGVLLQVYVTFVAQQVRPLLFAAAQAETSAEYCVTGRPVETVQKLMIRRDALIQVRGSILISVCVGGGGSMPHPMGHTSLALGLRRSLQPVGSWCCWLLYT